VNWDGIVNMNYEEWKTKILEENQIETIIKHFTVSEDMVLFIDRHIIDSINDLPKLDDADNFWSVCNVAFALLEKWHDYVFELANTDILASIPYLVINDEWLQRQQTAPPPHICLDLAKQSRYLKPKFFFHASAETDPLDIQFKNWLMGKGNWKVKIKNPNEKYGSWIIML
jgi:hypothetical protein